MDFVVVITVVVAIFAIVNPVGNISFFVTLTQGYSREEKNAVIRKTIFVAGGVLAIFALLGNYIFELFSITIPAFRIAGGILLLTIAFSMLQGSHPKSKVTDQDKEEALQREAVGIVPLGIPMFAGPGSITTVMIYISDATSTATTNWNFIIGVYLGIALIMIISYILLYYGEVLFEKIGRMGALAFSRIMGLILAAMAVQFILEGLKNGLLAGL
ncbi:MAG: MarC family protein [Candidatus Thermoplasmatota archaeon]|nr:NAAT family transporter [Euryarchaeota archaeon]MBU4032571.1 MarC family protein [Candidatus Thermoplasmatota archaeon]MBU4070574.1 MarC family protein [Candidatus Thermoplasmatota archaeon]MBU4144143.1 MarC family protein [Candidatus Thermoplasmatota archaeon]MBU4591171.1 MarC family protein [Candidatus Thermoplasmatota archaeon]